MRFGKSRYSDSDDDNHSAGVTRRKSPNRSNTINCMTTTAHAIAIAESTTDTPGNANRPAPNNAMPQSNCDKYGNQPPATQSNHTQPQIHTPPSQRRRSQVRTFEVT